MSEQVPDALVVQSIDGGSIPGSIRIHCTGCPHEAWLAPSGQAVLRDHPEVKTICVHCIPSGPVQMHLAPGAHEELAAEMGDAAAEAAEKLASEFLARRDRNRGRFN